MARYLLRRLVLTIPVVFGVATLVFALIHLVPGDPAQAMLGEGASADASVTGHNIHCQRTVAFRNRELDLNSSSVGEIRPVNARWE